MKQNKAKIIKKSIFSIIVVLLCLYIGVCFVTYKVPADAWLNHSPGTNGTSADGSSALIPPGIEQKLLRTELLRLPEIAPADDSDITISPPAVNAKHAMVMDYETGRVLYAKNADQTTAMASTTKIMTALIVLERCNLQDEVIVSRAAALIEGSTMYLAEGEHITVLDLLYGLLLNSGNDAAVALAEYTAGSVESFCTLMNQRAKELGADHTNFTSPHGLDHPEHFTTAYDLALIAKRAYENELFRKIVNTREIHANGHYLNNTNPLLGVLQGVDGMKTGFTNNAGRCIVLTAQRSGIRIIVVLLGCETAKTRIQDGKALIEYALSEYAAYDILPRGYVVEDLYVTKGRSYHMNAVLETAVRLTLTKAELAKLQAYYIRGDGIDLTGRIPAIQSPVKKDQVIGQFTIQCGEETLYCGNIVAGSTVLRKTYTDFLSDIFRKWPYTLY